MSDTFKRRCRYCHDGNYNNGNACRTCAGSGFVSVKYCNGITKKEAKINWNDPDEVREYNRVRMRRRRRLDKIGHR